MPITVNSPYSGRPVKVRDQDVGRAVRDEDGRIFYVVPRSSGEGFYAAPTRKGSEKDEQRYDDMLDKLERSEEQVAETQHAPRDATGNKRRRPVLWLLLLILLIVAAGVAYMVLSGNGGGLPLIPPPDEPPAESAEPGEGATGDWSGNAVDVAVGASEVEAASPPSSPSASIASAFVTQAMALDADAGDNDADSRLPSARDSDRGEFTTLASGLMYRIDRQGVGQAAKAGRYVELRYRDKAFDSPADLDNQPWEAASFVLWTGDAPRGWDQAIAGMKPGEVRTTLIPQPAADGEMRYDVAEFELLAVLPGVTHDIELTGQGPVARPGDRVVVSYKAFVQGADEHFADTRRMGGPVGFTLGGGEVIEGLELGVAGMRRGELRTITIPPHLAYGSKAIGDVVPAGSTLVFVVELVEIE